MEKIFCYLLPFSVNDEDIKVAAFTCNIESFAIAFLVFFFLVFLYGAVFRWTGNFSCLINFDLLPRASVTRIKLNSLDALIYIFLHLSIVIQDAVILIEQYLIRKQLGVYITYIVVDDKVCHQPFLKKLQNKLKLLKKQFYQKHLSLTT